MWCSAFTEWIPFFQTTPSFKWISVTYQIVGSWFFKFLRLQLSIDAISLRQIASAFSNFRQGRYCNLSPYFEQPRAMALRFNRIKVINGRIKWLIPFVLSYCAYSILSHADLSRQSAWVEWEAVTLSNFFHLTAIVGWWCSLVTMHSRCMLEIWCKNINLFMYWNCRSCLGFRFIVRYHHMFALATILAHCAPITYVAVSASSFDIWYLPVTRATFD